VRRWLRERRTRCSLPEELAATDTARRLLGDYPPYVMEAAQEIAATGEARWAPLLEQAVERLIAERPPGWREMTGAMVDALGEIGDPRCLPLLERVARTPGAEELANLPRIIASMQHSALLLRSAQAAPGDLLRASRSDSASNPETLLRRPSE
jgi:hypothetical protein